LRVHGKVSLDVALSGSSTFLRNKDLLASLPDRLILPEVKDRNKWSWSRGHGFKFNDREQRYILQTSERLGGYILVNTKAVKREPLASWQDLLKPQWKGKIASHDPRGSGVGQEVASYLLVKLGEKFIVDLFKGQKITLTRSYSQVADWVARGKYSIGIAQTADRIEQLRKEGIPFKAFSLPDAPGTITGGFSVVGMFKGGQHPNAATVFLNWILTKKGQEAFLHPLLYPSLRTDVPRHYVPAYTIPKSGVEYIDTYGEDFVAIRNKLGVKIMNLVGR